MTSTVPIEGPIPIKKTATRRQIRGSSLLLTGRLLSKGLNFAIQVLIVRYLSQTDYGAFAYALSVVKLSQSLITFGLDWSITRFVPIYHERQDYNRLFGTITMAITSILSLGLAVAFLINGFQGFIQRSVLHDQDTLALLLLLIFLAPVQAIDELLVGMFAVFASPRAIFFRKHVLAPVLKLGVVLLLIWGQSGVFFLAGGYLAASLLGVAIYLVILVRVLLNMGLLQHFNLRTIIIPWREVLAFTVPMLMSDLMFVVMNAVDAIILEYFYNVTEVAALRAVQPTALMNQLVMASFATLFTPLASRMFARKDQEGINNLYWQTAIWIAVFSFPIFAVTFSLAHPITILLYGTRYESSAVILALLSLGYYFNAALGFNGLTLKVSGKIRYVVVLNILAMLANLGLNLILIPRYGALGAAIGTSSTVIIYNILKQTGLRLGTGINLFEWRYFRVYTVITLSATGLLLIQWLTDLPVYASIFLAGLTSLLVLRFSAHLLDINETFPELLRIPLLRRILTH